MVVQRSTPARLVKCVFFTKADRRRRRRSAAKPSSIARSGTALTITTPTAANGTRQGAPTTRPVAQPHVAVAVLRVRADDRDRHDRQQRRRLGLDLVEAEEDHERRDEQRRRRRRRACPAIDAARRTPMAIAPTHPRTSSTALASSTAANSSEIARPARAAAATCPRQHAADRRHADEQRRRARARCRRGPASRRRRAAMKTIAASDVPVASRSLVAEPEDEQRHDHGAAADAEQPAEEPGRGADRRELQRFGVARHARAY